MTSSALWTRTDCVVPFECPTHNQWMDDGDGQNTSMWSVRPSMEQFSSSSSDSSWHTQRPIKSELTSSPDFRLSRPSTLPRSSTLSPTSSKVAISAQNYNNYIANSQDVPLFVNHSATYLSSPATRSDAFSHHLGPSVSSFATTSPNVLTQRRKRPRTSNQVFTSSHGPIAPHGLPKSLPPAPSTAPRRTQPQPPPPESFYSDFASMSSNYLNMLASKSVDNTMSSDITTVPTVSPADLEAPMAPDMNMNNHPLQDLADFIKQDMRATSQPSPQPSPPPETPDLSTSPNYSDYGDFDNDGFLSGVNWSPLDDPLDTPVVPADQGDGMLTGMPLFPELMSGMGLFGGTDFYSEYSYEKPAPLPILPSSDKLITMTPESPAISDFSPSINPSSIYPSRRLPSDRSSFPSPAPSSVTSTSATRRKSSATGTRKGITPGALVPLDAPTQPRRYMTPSATSRKEVPSVFARKRSRSTAFGDDDDEGNEPPLPPNATEKEQIEYKRRQNTVAARRSRARKLQHEQDLKDEVERLTKDVDTWKTRADLLASLLVAHGVTAPTFSAPTQD